MSRDRRIASVKGFSILEAVVLIVVVALVTISIIAASRSGVGKVTDSAIDVLVKQECAQVTRPPGDGEIGFSVGQISEFGLMDAFGPSFEVRKVKVLWKYEDGRCSYLIEAEYPNGKKKRTEESTVTL